MTKTRVNYFTSESVTIGHPDKTADIISDTILQEILSQDKNARVACETLLAKNLVVLAGEITTTADVDYEKIVRETIRRIGFTDEAYGLDADTVRVLVNITEQSPEIYHGVFGQEQGAGDQGIIYGFAVKDNRSYFPAAGKIAHLLSERLTQVRRLGNGSSILLPDGKTQVTLKYVDGKPVAVDTILISTQHKQGTGLKEVEELVREEIIFPVLNYYLLEESFLPLDVSDVNILVNPAGEWHLGSSYSDTGLTGRKIIVDSYLGYAKHGGGAYSGKDPSKTDRSAAYALRHVAKNVVAAGLADVLELQVSYAIGKAEPVSFYANTSGTSTVPETELERIIQSEFSLTPAGIIEGLSLRSGAIPYAVTAENGHFGKHSDSGFTWEFLDKVDSLKR